MRCELMGLFDTAWIQGWVCAIAGGCRKFWNVFLFVEIDFPVVAILAGKINTGSYQRKLERHAYSMANEIDCV